MKQISYIFLGTCIGSALSLSAKAQALEENPLVWEREKIEIGPVMEEHGTVFTEFFVLNSGAAPVVIKDVLTDCGCTTADFTSDTLYQDRIGAVKIAYEPGHSGGGFQKKIVVKSNVNPSGDTLQIEGYNIPLPNKVETYYAQKVGDLGFRFSSVNMGEVFTDQPKVKFVDFYNYKDMAITLDEQKMDLPAHLKISMIPAIVPAKSRGMLAIQYDGAAKEDLGFFDEQVTFFIESNRNEGVALRLLTTVYEYFEPVPKSEMDNVPKLAISEVEVDLNKISSGHVVSKHIVLTNIGNQPINIRKVATNCDCVVVDLEKEDLLPGEKSDLLFSFDPKGRMGIDHKTITIFSNDPLKPTRTIMVKSKIN